MTDKEIYPEMQRCIASINSPDPLAHHKNPTHHNERCSTDAVSLLHLKHWASIRCAHARARLAPLTT